MFALVRPQLSYSVERRFASEPVSMIWLAYVFIVRNSKPEVAVFTNLGLRMLKENLRVELNIWFSVMIRRLLLILQLYYELVRAGISLSSTLKASEVHY